MRGWCTFQDMLQQIYDLIEQNQGYDKSIEDPIRAVVKGILPPEPVFPAIAVLPVAERITGVWSGAYYSDRTVTIEVYTKGFKERECVEQGTRIGRRIERLFSVPTGRALWQSGLTSQMVLGIQTQQVQLGNPLVYKNGFLQQTVIPLKCQVRGLLPTNRYYADNVDDADDLTWYLYETIKQNLGDYFLDSHFGSVSPLAKYPAFAVLEATAESSPEKRGQDRNERVAFVHILTKLYYKNTSIEECLERYELVRNLLLADLYREGRAWQSRISEASFGLDTAEDPTLYDIRCSVVSFTRKGVIEL